MPFADPARRAEYLREWRKRNPGKNAAYVRRYYLSHLEQERAARRKYNREHPPDEQERAARRRYYQEHPDIWRRKETRRKLQMGTTEEPGIRDFLKKLRSASVWCYICWRPLSKPDVHIDHIIPLSRGGEHTRANIAPVCRSCNSRKHTRLLSEMADEDCAIWHELHPL